jgi:(p)ppGpp synthase/HD superfamily hydrolase
MTTLEDTILLTAQAHKEQTDKAGEPYMNTTVFITLLSQ